MKRLLFAFILFSISSIFPAAKVETMLKDASAKIASSQALLNGALVLTRDISFEQHGRVSAVSSDGRSAVCVKHSPTPSDINLVDMSTGNLLWTRKGIGVCKVQISKNNRFVLISWEAKHEIIDLNNGNLIHSFIGCIVETNFSDDSRFLIGYDIETQQYKIMDLTAKNLSWTYTINDKLSHFLEGGLISNNHFVTLSFDATKSNLEIRIRALHGNLIKAILLDFKGKHFTNAKLWMITDDNKFAVIGYRHYFAHCVCLVNLVTGQIVSDINTTEFDNRSMIMSIAISSDNNFIVLGCCNSMVIDLNTGKLLHIIMSADHHHVVSISSDNRFVTTISDGVIKITDLRPSISSNLNSTQIELINWMYKNRINNPNSPIVLDTAQSDIFLTFNEVMQKLLLNNYDLKMKGLKPSFSNSVNIQF